MHVKDRKKGEGKRQDRTIQIKRARERERQRERGQKETIRSEMKRTIVEILDHRKRKIYNKMQTVQLREKEKDRERDYRRRKRDVY